MAYVKTDDEGAIAAYPYTLRQLRGDNPRVGFPKTIPDEMAADYGVHPVTVADRPDVAADEIAERDELPTLVEGAWVLGWTVRDMTPEELADVQTRRSAEVNEERDRRLYAGSVVAVTGYGNVPLQGRPNDQTNLIALEVSAMQLVAAGLTVPINFRDAENVMHSLTPAQMLELAQKGKQAASAIYAAAWALKDGAAIPADFADAQYWP